MRFAYVTMFISMLFCGVAFAAPEPGAIAPDFEAVDTHGNMLKLSEQRGKIVVLEWKNHLCPFVRKHYGSHNMQQLQEELAGQGVVWWSVISSAEGKQGNVTADEANAIVAEEGSHASAVLLDAKGEIGRLYGAKTTPHMFVIAEDGRLAYMGAIDDNPSPDPGTIPGAKNYVRKAVSNLQAAQAVEESSIAPYGCSVKY